MKPSWIRIEFAFLLAATAMGGEKSARVVVKNPGDFDRQSETIQIFLKDVGLEGDSVSPVVIDRKTGTLLLSQLSDDMLLFQSDFTAREEKEFLLTWGEGNGVKPASLVDGRFETPREDYAWENDRIAFRMYGPALAAEVNNGIDVWTKRVRYLIVDKWYTESARAGKDTYHEDHGEGADLFSVGRSLGAGGCGLWSDGKVLQPGVFSSYRSLETGPLRVSFELTYENWKVGGRPLTERLRISLDAGSNLNKIEVRFEGAGVGDSLELACGLVKRGNTLVSKDPRGRWLSLWGLTTDDTANGCLGTGIVFVPRTSARFEEDRDQYLSISTVSTGGPYVYYAGAGWTRSGDFPSGDAWKSYLAAFARRLSLPLKVTVKKN